METVVAVSTDWRQASLDTSDRAMLAFTEKLTLLPSAITEGDVADLRAHGFADESVLAIVLAGAFRTFHTTVADSIGLELTREREYSAEVLHAFGVTETEARTTMYDERTGPSASAINGPKDRGRPADGARLVDRVCWIATDHGQLGANGLSADGADGVLASHPMRNLALACSLKSGSWDAILDFGRQVSLGGSGLGRRIEAVVGLTVSAVLSVPYTAAHSARVLTDSGATAHEVRALADDPAGGTLEGTEREASRFAEKLTSRASSMERSDIEALRSTGLDDRQIVKVACCAAYENFLSRATAGLGVRLEEEIPALQDVAPFSS